MLNNEWNMHIDGMNELWFISIQLELILYTWNVNSQVSESLTSGVTSIVKGQGGGGGRDLSNI